MENVFEIKNSKLYLPDHETDSLQICIRGLNNYWDYPALEMIDKYISDGATIVDMGANLGNHSVYWGVERNAKRVYAFEPFDRMYKVLTRNIELNNLEDIVIPYNVGLYNVETKADVMLVWEQNLGGTTFRPDENGPYKLVTFDSLNIEDKIDLIKIDVESLEIQAIEGAIESIKKNLPVIVVEIHSDKNRVEELLFPLGYKLVETIRENEDYIYAVE